MKTYRVTYKVYVPMCGVWMDVEKQQDVPFESEDALRESSDWKYSRIVRVVELQTEE